MARGGCFTVRNRISVPCGDNPNIWETAGYYRLKALLKRVSHGECIDPEFPACDRFTFIATRPGVALVTDRFV